MSHATVEHTIDSLARRLVRLRFDVPAQFFLEAHLPFCAIIHTAGLLFEPVATPFLGTERIHSFQEVFSDRENLSRLMQRIEFYRTKAAH